MTEYRIEHDTMGEVKVPVFALWRAQEPSLHPWCRVECGTQA